MFSFNNPYGACPVCYGSRHAAAWQTPTSSFPTGSKSILDGAIQASGWNNVKDDSICPDVF